MIWIEQYSTRKEATENLILSLTVLQIRSDADSVEFGFGRIRISTYPAVWQIRIILIRIRIQMQDVKKFVTDPDPGGTLIRIRIQGKTIRIRIQQQRTKYQENL